MGRYAGDWKECKTRIGAEESAARAETTKSNRAVAEAVNQEVDRGKASQRSTVSYNNIRRNRSRARLRVRRESIGLLFTFSEMINGNGPSYMISERQSHR